MAARIAALMLMLCVLTVVPLRAQDAAPPAPPAPQSAQPSTSSFAFEVATIKPSGPDSHQGGGFYPAGYYRVQDYALSWIVASAYFGFFEKGHEVIGMPGWAEKEHYDVVARVDEVTAASLSKLPPRQWQVVERPMLRKLLEERCKLVAQMVPSQADGYVIVVGKGGPHLTPTKPGEMYPPGVKGVGDGLRVLWTSDAAGNVEKYYNATLDELAERLSWAWPVMNRTNLTGRYDFTIRRTNGLGPDGQRIADPQPNDLWDISSTGLEVKRAKIPSENLVVEHIERPSAN